MNYETITRILVTLGVAAGTVTLTATEAAATQGKDLGRTLGKLWETVLGLHFS